MVESITTAVAATASAATLTAAIAIDHHRSRRTSAAVGVEPARTDAVSSSTFRVSVSSVAFGSSAFFAVLPRPVPRLIVLPFPVVKWVAVPAAPAGPWAFLVRDCGALWPVEAEAHVVLQLADGVAWPAGRQLDRARPLPDTDQLVGAFLAAHHAQRGPGEGFLHPVRLDSGCRCHSNISRISHSARRDVIGM